MSGEASHPGAVGAVPRVARERYEVGERLPNVAFFHVYRGYDRQTGQPVLLKVLKPELAASEHFVRNLQAELSDAARLQHAQIVAVRESWQERGTLVLVTEGARGISLEDRIERVAPFPLAVAIDIAIGIAAALDYAAHRGMVHGDLRPENVLITPEGEVKVADFGVGGALTSNTGVQLSAWSGLAAYLPPEVANGAPPAPSSDVYALGAILHEMLCGSAPFAGDSPLAVAVKHQKDPPPALRTLRADVPPAVEGIVLKCLEKNPDMRYAGASTLLYDLRRVQEALRADRPLNWSPLEAREPSRRREAMPAAYRPEPAVIESGGPSWKWLTALGVVVFGLILGGYLFFLQITSAPPDVQVPGVLGQPLRDAERDLGRLGLQVEIKREYNEGHPTGVVYSSNPIPGTLLKQGQRVTLYVSQGLQPTIVPDVVDQTLEEARRLLREAKLAQGRMDEEYSVTVEQGKVISQTPAASQPAPPGSTVDLIVSKGTEQGDEPEVDVTSRSDNRPDRYVPPNDGGSDGRLQDLDVFVRIPNSGFSPVQVRIIVDDRDETAREVYNRYHSPGDEFVRTVTARGDEGDVRIRVLFDTRLVWDERY